jgi:CHASE3 domain sensor protein
VSLQFGKQKGRYRPPADKRTLKLKDKAKLMVGLPMIVQLAVVLCLMWLLHDGEVKQAQQMQANAVIFESGNLLRTMHDAGIAIGGYCITRTTIYADKFDQMMGRQRDQGVIGDHLHKLRDLVKGNPRQEIAMARLEEQTQAGIELLKNARHSIGYSSQMQGFRQVRDLYSELKDVTSNMGREIDSITAESHAVQENSAAAWEQSKWLVRFFMFLALGGNILIALALYSYFNSSVVRRLAIVADNVSRAMRREPLSQRLAGCDEIADLDQNLHVLSSGLPAESSLSLAEESPTGQPGQAFGQSIKSKDEINQL